MCLDRSVSFYDSGQRHYSDVQFYDSISLRIKILIWKSSVLHNIHTLSLNYTLNELKAGRDKDHYNYEKYEIILIQRKKSYRKPCVKGKCKH